jgi:3D-(3,5/4)-trihydroxycyclohexane-1,2-dione acylhydrolase (decyclizing)
MPQDVQAEAFDFPARLFEPRVHTIPRTRPDAALLARAVDLVAASRRPIIVAGGGVLYSEAEEALEQLASRFGIPVVETQAGKGSLPWDHPLQMGPAGVTGGLAANRLSRDADLVLAVGTRLSDFTTASWTAWQDPDVRFVGINVTELDGQKAAAMPLVADARVALTELTDRLEACGWPGVAAERRALADRLRSEWNDEVDRVGHLSTPVHISQPEVIRLVNEATGAKGVVVGAAGGLPGDLHKLWRTPRSGGYHLEYGYSTMGYEIAGGLGVKLAEPDAEVYVMLGDGSYLMLATEIATAVQEDRKITVVLLDNHGFQCISNLSTSCGGANTFNQFRRRDERTGRLTGDFLPIDFAANAASLGADVLVAHSPTELESALADAKKHRNTTVVVTEVDPSVGVPSYDSWWDVPVAEVSTSDRVRDARRVYEEGARAERQLV